jgi:hypothetical protein
MSLRVRDHLRNNIVGYVALFIALSGATYAASVPKNSVTSSSIKKGAVKGIDVAKNTLTGADVKEGSLSEVPSATSAGLLDGLDSSAFLRDSEMAGGDLAGTFSSLSIRAGAVGPGNLSSGAVRAQNVAPNGSPGVDAPVPLVFFFAIDNGGDQVRTAPRPLLVIDVWTIGKTGDAGTVTLEGPGNTPITEAIDPEDGVVVRAANIDPGEYNLTTGETLTADASNALVDAQVIALAIPNIAP